MATSEIHKKYSFVFKGDSCDGAHALFKLSGIKNDTLGNHSFSLAVHHMHFNYKMSRFYETN